MFTDADLPSLLEVEDYLRSIENSPKHALSSSSHLSIDTTTHGQTNVETKHPSPPPGPSEWIVSLSHHGHRTNGCPELCKVCGDRATGYHYDAISCNGCKTFFRRSVMDKREYVCKTGGQCFSILPRDNRMSCRFCRMERCVEAGMNPLTFQTSEDLQSNPVSKRILEKRKREAARRERINDELAEKSVGLCPSKMAPRAVEQSFTRLIDELIYLEIKHEKIRKSSYNPSPSEHVSIEDILRKHSMLHNYFDEMPGWPLPMVDPDWIPLDILLAEKRPQPQGKDRGPHAKMWMYADLIYSVEYAKAMPIFARLDERDKILLLKSSIVLCMNLTAIFYSFSVKSDCNIHPDGTSPARTKNYPGFIGVVDQYMCRMIATCIQSNMRREEYVLLKAILLCNEACDDLSSYAMALLKRERERLVNSLVSFSLASRGPIEGPTAVATILGMADTVNHQVKRQKEQYLLAGINGLRRIGNPILDFLMD